MVFEDEQVVFLQDVRFQGALRHSGVIIPRQHRETVFDLSEEETVATLGWPRGTVQSRTSRAQAKLRGLLDREEVRNG